MVPNNQELVLPARYKWYMVSPSLWNILPDIPHGSAMKFVSVDIHVGDNHEAAESAPGESSDLMCRGAVTRQPRRSDRAPGIVVEGSIDCQYNSEDCSYFLDIRRGDPYCRARRPGGKEDGWVRSRLWTELRHQML